ncbi:hypothetical protein ANCCEY_08323 [Ancylostoma ceylanicum]|uniref:Uncharacterized protein n=1 Tax=Ancylostoma ceylanicum TaxID=53326 RepID=A0A0D6LKT8_9BILA|nr:hypothetical protein ANCCEY_08323 [Ancylostoma ceylanicum]
MVWILAIYFQVRTHPEKFGVGKVMSRTQSHEKMQSLNTKKDLKSVVNGVIVRVSVSRGFLTRKHLDEQGLLSPTRSRSSLHSHDSDENHN